MQRMRMVWLRFRLCRRQGQHDRDRRAVVGTTINDDAAAQKWGALANTEQTEGLRMGRLGHAAAVVLDDQYGPAAVHRQRYVHRGGFGVANDVGEGFLRDAIER